MLRAWPGDMEIRKDDNITKEFMVLTHDTVPTNESETKKVLREKKGSTHGYYCLMLAHMLVGWLDPTIESLLDTLMQD